MKRKLESHRQPHKPNVPFKWMTISMPYIGDFHYGVMSTKAVNKYPTYDVDEDQWKVNPKGEDGNLVNGILGLII